MHLIQHTNQAKRHSIALQLDMASSKLIALLFAFDMAAAALHPSEAARLQVVQQASKPVAASQEAAEKVADQAAAGAGGVARPSTTPPLPGIPAGLPPNLLAAIPELLFPGLGAARHDSAHAAWRARPAAPPGPGRPTPGLPCPHRPRARRAAVARLDAARTAPPAPRSRAARTSTPDARNRAAVTGAPHGIDRECLSRVWGESNRENREDKG